MHELLKTVFTSLAQARIDYCLLRDYDHLDQLVEGEIDLLVRESHFPKLARLLERHGFVSSPNWGHAPHQFFVAYSQTTDTWFKLDVVTALAYGKPVHAIDTPLAASCLAKRQRAGLVFIPSPEDELVTLLLHCILDKGYFTPARCQRLKALRRQITDESYLSALLVLYWLPTITWPGLAALIDQENWTALVAQRTRVAARLTNRDRFGVLKRQVMHRVLRKLNRWLYAQRPPSLAVAFLAPDGAGKSTLVEGIQKSFYFPVVTIYMGLYQKGTKPSILSRILGLRFAQRLGRQWVRYLTARYHLSRRRLVVFDRYTYDALVSAPSSSALLKRWRRWLLAYACPAPDLIVVLDAPGDLLYARKGEHNSQHLERQRQSYLNLQRQLPQTVIIDATRSADQVRREVIALIWRSYSNHPAGSNTPPIWDVQTAEA